MHELAVTQSILQTALGAAEKSNASQITDIHLVIGQLSSIVDDSVMFYWDMIAVDTIAKGARLHFQRPLAQFRCKNCQLIYPLTGDFTCPTCGSAHVELISGDAFYLESIEVV
jgi:hydrogenase nickel incorporation protein HypA/HybF